MNVEYRRKIITFITTYFSDTDLNTLAFTEFPDFHNRFASISDKQAKALKLVEWCIRREQEEKLMRLLKQEREKPFERFFALQSPTTPSSTPPSSLAETTAWLFGSQHNSDKNLILTSMPQNLIISVNDFPQQNQATVYQLNEATGALHKLWSESNVAILPQPVFLEKQNLLLLNPVFEWNQRHGGLYAVDVQTRKAVCITDLQGDVSTPVITSNGIFITTSKKQRILLQYENNFSKVWAYDFPYWQRAQTAVSDSDQIYVSAGKSNILRYQQDNGHQTKQYQLHQEQGNAVGQFAVTDTHLFIGTSNGHIIAFDKESAKQVWVKQPGRGITTGLLAWGNNLYAGSKNYQAKRYEIIALCQNDGAFAWETPFAAKRHFKTPLTMYQNSLLCGCDDHHLYALDPLDGTIQWTHQMSRGIRARPVITTAKYIYVADRNGRLVQLAPRTLSAGEYSHGNNTNH